MTQFTPFANDSQSLSMGADDLTLENKGDRVSIYGNIDIARDKKGLAQARTLAKAFADMVAALEKESLPDEIKATAVESKTVENPFGT